jgi:transcriptional regulator GlxA family with amidase domain
MLEESTLPLQRIAFESGFSSAQALRRAFRRRLGVTPREHRSRSRQRN